MDAWTQKLEGLRSDFEGGRARLFLYTVTHNTAVVDVHGSQGTRVFIVLSGCTGIRAPSSWRFGIPLIEKIQDEVGLYKFIDASAGVAVEFEHLEIRDNYPAVGELP